LSQINVLFKWTDENVKKKMQSEFEAE